MGSVCSEIPDLSEVVEGVVCQSDQVVEGQIKEVGNPASGYHGMMLKWRREENKFPFGS